MVRTVALLLVILLTAPSAAAAEGPRLLGPNGAPIFVVGMNYEGPADRAWQMWDTGKFDAALIEADFRRATAAGVNVVRVFVQGSLATEINANRWDRLDQVLGLAEKHRLQLIVSLHDYGERDLARVTATAERVAARYRGRPGILAYDLKNEPRFNDLSLTRYAAPPPLQQRSLIDTFGERLPKSELAEYRATEDGQRTVPSTLGEDEAWIYVNNLRLYRDLLADGSAWVRARNFQRTTLDYLADADGAKWAPFVNAMDNTLRAWLTPQVEAIRRADPGRPITVDHVDAVMASLPANGLLDVQTLHRYPSTGAASVRATLNVLASLQRTHAGKPYLLGEFGYATESLDPARAALHEVAIYLGLLAQGAAGGSKWMLNDMPAGFNMRERTLGAFRLDGTPKPVVPVLAALRHYLDQTGSPPGDLRLEDDRETGLRYVYRSADALLLGGRQVDGGSVKLAASGPAHLFVTWTVPGVLRIFSSAAAQVIVDVPALVGPTADEPRLVRLVQNAEQPLALGAPNGSSLTLTLDQPGTYVLHVGPPPRREPEYTIPGGRFYTQTNGREASGTGFSVTNQDGIPVWDAFQALGGVDVLGFPVSRRFELDGFTVQVFQKMVLQWRPDQSGTFWFLNTFDVLHERGRDEWLEAFRQTPPPFDNAADAALTWDGVITRHLALLDDVPAPLRDRFLANPSWLDHYGLPVSTREYPNSVVVRAQRATFQYWKETVPWAKQGEVSVANGGDLAKEAGLWPTQAVTPENPPR